MGVAASTRMGIAIDSDETLGGTHRAGSVISGKVWAATSKPLTKVTDLKLQFVGREFTSVRHERGNGARSHQEDRAILCSQQSMRNAWRSFVDENGTIRAGRFTIPFRIEIPPHAPSSMVLNHKSSCHCRLEYRVEAILYRKNFRADSCEATVTVRAQTPDLSVPRPFHVSPIKADVKVLSMFGNKGHVIVGGRLSTHIIPLGGQTLLSVACRNHSKIQIQRFTAQLQQEVTYRASSWSERHKTVHQKFDLATNIASLVPSLVVPQHDNAELNLVNQELLEGQIRQVMQMPHTAYPSYQGHLIQVKHFIKIKVDTGVGVNNPEIRIPIQCVEHGPQRSIVVPTAPTVPATTTVAPSAPTEAMVFPPSAPVEPFPDNDMHIPMAMAVPVEFSEREESVQSATAEYLPASHAIIGGPSLRSYGIGEQEAPPPHEGIHPPVPSAPPAFLADNDTPPRPSLELLWQEMRDSVMDLGIVLEHLQDSKWESVLNRNTLTPAILETTIGLVNKHWDKPAVAALLAQRVCGDNDALTCAQAAAMVRNAPDDRVSMVRVLLPFMTRNELLCHGDDIKAELTGWEKVLTEADFERC